jgi:hypothetical protein
MMVPSMSADTGSGSSADMGAVIRDEARVGRARHFVEQVADALDIVIVERRVDLVTTGSIIP